ncbi:hydrolase/acyltransferase [Paenibacillus radicis (ex Xue et al. 2023)]|uniref:Hydrolase/acyltransferase n=1 Tax=Paenibacillus radicis (ex Xue et al. 2023) TaxID=2972489 RepID=A0ABT1YTH9_9BACL|nr:hydrolase/acyltransferase [Paenibacillus radicis (ex Xue et al. 2023)]MCR8636005.1 hydrolase/acyltransferase [Paenibacillus radicis (ex Xue et al. 2023)]
MSKMRYAVLQLNDHVEFVELPATHTYQLTALNKRLHKELDKLTASNVPSLPKVIAECDELDIVTEEHKLHHGLEYINELEKTFSSIKEEAYPLVSLLTEIRALQAQLEQWYEDEEELAN